MAAASRGSPASSSVQTIPPPKQNPMIAELGAGHAPSELVRPAAMSPTRRSVEAPASAAWHVALVAERSRAALLGQQVDGEGRVAVARKAAATDRM